MDGLQPWHLILLAVVFIMLFGWKRLPDASRAIGRSLRIFKSEVKGLHTDDAVEPLATTPVLPVAQPMAQPMPVAQPMAQSMAQPVAPPVAAPVAQPVAAAPAATPVATPLPAEPPADSA